MSLKIAWCNYRSPQLGIKHTWVPILTLPLTRDTVLGKLFNFRIIVYLKNWSLWCSWKTKNITEERYLVTARSFSLSFLRSQNNGHSLFEYCLLSKTCFLKGGREWEGDKVECIYSNSSRLRKEEHLRSGVQVQPGQPTDTCVF